ncbi:putative transporter small subunit [Arthrobacter glacialis]|nr:putative transporter small subunit [Arthrobacter glacialis]
MTAFFLTLYVLIWPVIVAGVLYVLGKAFIQEIRDARREGRPLI